jgi:hypothetical protein
MGKSLLAQRLLEEKGWPILSTDVLTRMLELNEQTSYYSQEKADQFYNYFDKSLDSFTQLYENYVIEGDAFYPQHLHKLSQKHQFKSLFLINTAVTADHLMMNVGRNNWLHSETPEAVKILPARIKDASMRISQECDQLGIKCFDLTKDRDKNLAKAYDYLVQT